MSDERIQALVAVDSAGELQPIEHMRAFRLACLAENNVNGALDAERYCAAAAQLRSREQDMTAWANQWNREAVEFAVAVGEMLPKETGGRGNKLSEASDSLGMPPQTRGDYRALSAVPEPERVAFYEKCEKSGDTISKSKLRSLGKAIVRHANRPDPEDFAEGFAPELHHCSLESLPVEPGTVDAIITDPPYPREFLPVYAELAQCATRWLRPGGSLVVMCGNMFVPEILASMTPIIPYQWMLAYFTPGEHSTVRARRVVNNGWKPVLWFVNGEGDDVRHLGYDVIKSDANDKAHHHWGQSESGMSRLVEAFTHPGEMIVDPFLGGGTTAIVAARLKRRFVGCDIDADALRRTRERFV